LTNVIEDEKELTIIDRF